MSSSPLYLYGVPFSQPVRAVIWLLLYKDLPFELKMTNPGYTGENGSRHPDFLAKNPGGTIPCLEEPDTGFIMAEGHAILCYLCNRHGWTDLYPKSPSLRAIVDWYLHYHHRSLREASIALITPKVRKDLNIPEAMQAQSLRTLERAFEALDQGWLARRQFLASDELSIADFAAYMEIGQLQSCFTNLYDFASWPNVQRWLRSMQQVKAHDQAHIALKEMGDISQGAPDMDTIRRANKLAMAALR